MVIIVFTVYTSVAHISCFPFQAPFLLFGAIKREKWESDIHRRYDRAFYNVHTCVAVGSCREPEPATSSGWTPVGKQSFLNTSLPVISFAVNENRGVLFKV